MKIWALCKAARVSISGYYYFLSSENHRRAKDLPALKVIEKYFKKSREKGGARTIDMMIRLWEKKSINHKKIERIMREYGLIAKIRSKNPYKNLPTSESCFVPNLLKRDFIVPFPDQVYSTDMTYLFYGSGEKAYLSATKDLATNEIVSYKLMRTPTISSFTNEFRELIDRIPVSARKSLTIHSDQGFQYTHPGFRNLLQEYGVTQSMSRRANCYDNAPIECFFGHFKDLLNLKGCKTYEDLVQEVDETMRYYNTERPQGVLNKKPPAVYRGLICSLF